MDQPEELYTAAQVAARLDLTGSMVRRYGLAYEAVTGQELPRDPKTHGRLYTNAILATLEQARAVVRANNNVSAEDAIRSVLNLVTAPTAPAIPNAVVTEEVLALLHDMRNAMLVMQERLEALEATNKALLTNVPTSLSEGEQADDRLALLERRNAYLEGELKRRDAVPQPSQSWWKFWAKS